MQTYDTSVPLHQSHGAPVTPGHLCLCRLGSRHGPFPRPTLALSLESSTAVLVGQSETTPRSSDRPIIKGFAPDLNQHVSSQRRIQAHQGKKGEIEHRGMVEPTLRGASQVLPVQSTHPNHRRKRVVFFPLSRSRNGERPACHARPSGPRGVTFTWGSGRMVGPSTDRPTLFGGETKDSELLTQRVWFGNDMGKWI